MKKFFTIAVLVMLIAVGGFLIFRSSKKPSLNATPTVTPEPSVKQLTEQQAPKISLKFSSDAHYVTVNISNIHAELIEYNLIYDATVKGNQINTGVNATAKMDGKNEYSKQQLLGSESSGKFTYHANIRNAIMEITLRDSSGRSVYTTSYPFEVSGGSTINLTDPQ